MGIKSKDADARTKQTDFKFCETMYPPQPLNSMPVEWIVNALHLQDKARSNNPDSDHGTEIMTVSW